MTSITYFRAYLKLRFTDPYLRTQPNNAKPGDVFALKLGRILQKGLELLQNGPGALKNMKTNHVASGQKLRHHLIAKKEGRYGLVSRGLAKLIK